MEEMAVLVVDDEEDFLRTIVRRLGLRNIRAYGVPGGREALEFLKTNPIDVVVLDIKMPGMDGVTALAEIRKSHPLVEVIVLTGHVSVESSLEGEKLGAFDYIIKPVRIGELLTKIEAAYDRALQRRAGGPGLDRSE